jgi:hypothetical protein
VCSPSWLLLNTRHFAENLAVALALKPYLSITYERRSECIVICEVWDVKPDENMTNRERSNGRSNLEQLMALANEIARYASTNDQGQFERARAWQ